MARWVNPLMEVAMANINVAKPMLAWMGTMAPRQPDVAFSQHKQTKKLCRNQIAKFCTNSMVFFFVYHSINLFGFTGASYLSSKILTWKIRKQIAARRVPWWPSPTRSATSRNLAVVVRPNYANRRRPRNRWRCTEWPMHGKRCAPTWHRRASSNGTDDTTEWLGMRRRKKNSTNKQTNKKIVFKWYSIPMWICNLFLFRLAEEVGKTSGAWRPNKMQNQKTSQHRNMSFQIIPPRCLVQPQYRNKIVLLL